MLSLSSTPELIAQLQTARTIRAQAYTLHGRVLRALEAAARRGARVTVELEAHPFKDRNDSLARENEREVLELRAAGADAFLADAIHAKEIAVDDVLYLDEKNWHAGDVVLRENDPIEARAIPMNKLDALAQEAQLLDRAGVADDVIVESESFGAGNPTYDALKSLARSGGAPRLLVNERDLRTSRNERGILRGLVNAGVRVRLCNDSAKLAAAGESAWLGSANATFAGKGRNMTDWGVCTTNAAIVKTVRERLETQWQTASEFRVQTA